MPFLHELYLFFPELFIALNICALLGIGAFSKETQTADVRRMSWSCVIVLGGALFLLLVPHGNKAIVFHGMFEVNSFITYFKVLVILAAAAVLTLSVASLEYKKISSFEYPLLMLFAVLGMMIMLSANDFLLLFIGLELQALPLYVLVAFRRDQGSASEAALKYFVLGALSTALFLFGVSLLYGFSGTTNFQALQALLWGSISSQSFPLGGLVGMVFVAAALAFKVSAVPFHMWTPDVYEGTPTPVTAFLATASKIAAVGLMIRVFFVPFLAAFPYWQPFLLVLAVLSMFLGAFAAIAQQNIKRLLAYSTIGHMGYLLAAIAIGSEQGLQAVLLYLTLYAVMTVGMFGCLMMLRSRQEVLGAKLEDLTGLSQRHPHLAALIAILMFSFAGIPPLGGFFSKLLLFMAIVEKGYIWLAILGVLASVVACYYYLRIVKVMYLDSLKEGDVLGEPTLTLSWEGRLIFLFVALFTTVFFLIFPWLSLLINNTTYFVAS